MTETGAVRVAWDSQERAFVATDPTRRGCRATGFTALLAIKNLEQEQAAFDQARSAK